MTSIALKPLPPSGFDPLATEFVDDPYPMIARIHCEQPVFYYPPLNLWFVSKYDDVKDAYNDWRRFSSRAIGLIPVPEDLADKVPDLVSDGFLISLDPPEHNYHRQPVVKLFKHDAITGLEAALRKTANALIDEFIAKGSCDLMRDFCYPLSLSAMMSLFDIPVEGASDYRRWSDHFLQLMTVRHINSEKESPQHPMADTEVRAHWEQLCDANALFRKYVDMRLAVPGADLISAMLGVKYPNGDSAEPGMAIRNMMLLISGGHDTTANLMGQLALLLMRNPDQWELLDQRPDLLPNAIEEALRRHGSAQGAPRVTTEGVTIRGVEIPADSFVYLMLNGAAHDDEIFDDPGRFDITRENARDNLSFGVGRHSCLGNTIARLEARVGMEELLRRIPRFSLVADGVVAIPQLMVLNLAELNVSW